MAMPAVEGRPPGPTVGVCHHGRPEHVSCDQCAAEQLQAPPEPDGPWCPHGNDHGEVDCMPCQRAADVGRPKGGGPRVSRLFEARVDSHCPICKRLIRAHIDKFGRHPLHEPVTCEDCTPRGDTGGA